MDLTGGLLHLAMMDYFYETDRGEDVIGGLTDGIPIYSNVASGIANGNVTHDETDFSIPNLGVSLGFSRHYDSFNTVPTPAHPGPTAEWAKDGRSPIAIGSSRAPNRKIRRAR
ncbi:MAG: hypothetical protein HQ567_17085 [Candidatus Nealsonbacteria bacterium]|nr:hypothetical protein [Candidatus Nealsonbacteria bacterium]